MTMPTIHKDRTNPRWIRVETRDGLITDMPRAAVQRALHNTQIGPDPWTIWLGWKVDESDCAAMLAAMDGRA